jgi:hypothetical protein
MPTKRNYGARPSVITDDVMRFDHRAAAARYGRPVLPISLSVNSPEIWDQTQSSSCTGHGFAGQVSNAMKAGNETDQFVASPLASYALGRVQGGQDPQSLQDQGETLLDLYQAAASRGVVDIQLWPEGDCTNVNVMPDDAALAFAAKHRLLPTFHTVQVDWDHLLLALAAGRTVAMASEIFQQFESDEAAETGIIQYPQPGWTSIGGHATVVEGALVYNGQEYADCRNSWGPNWARRGRFLLPKDYLRAGLVWELWQGQAVA